MGSLEPFVADIWPDLPEASRFHGNKSAHMLAATVSRERAQGICWHDRMVWAAFLPHVPGLALVRSTRARPPVPILDLGGYALW